MNKLMTKIHTLLLCVFASSLSIYAQNKVPFTNLDGNVLMAAGGKENKSLFLFDTGASITVVSDKYCSMATCKTIRWMRIKDYMGKVKWHPVVRIPDFYIGDKHFKNVNAVLMKDLEREFSRFVCEKTPVEGILGANLLKQYNWEINFRDTTYRTEKTPIRYESGQPLKFRLKKGIPIISTLPVNGSVVGNVWFDTGDVNSLVLRPTVFKQIFTEDVSTIEEVAPSLNSATKKQFTAQVYRGNVTVLSNDYPLTVGAIAGKNFNNMGNGFLANSIVALNYSDKTIEIDKASTVAPPYCYMSVGIYFTFEEHTIRIDDVLTSVKEKHPELQVGMIVKTANGRNCYDIAAMCPCERRTFLQTLRCEDLEIATEAGDIYNLPAVY
jgi:predicted aspartyl protease